MIKTLYFSGYFSNFCSRLFAFCGFSLGKATPYVPTIQHGFEIVRPFSWKQKEQKLQKLQ